MLLLSSITALIACLMGLIIDSHMLLKFFLCYETFFFTLSVMMLIYSIDFNAIILVFYLMSNSTFEVMMGLSVLLMFSSMFINSISLNIIDFSFLF